MPSTAYLGVTVTRQVTIARRAYARKQAERWGACFVPQGDQPLRRLVHRFDAVLVFEQDRLRLADRHGDMAFHPGMAYQRIKRLSYGVVDPLVEVGRILPGQRVLDATLGFGQDALVAAVAVGPTGGVVGLEASRALAAFAEEGLRGCALPKGTNLEVSHVICVQHAEAVTWLTTTRQAFDLVLLDPMFRQPKRAQPSFDLLRRHALHAPLDDLLLKAALEKASTVVVKLGDLASVATLSMKPELVRPTRSVVWARFTP